MKQNHFLLIAAIIAWIFGLTMMLTPEKMLDNLSSEINTTVKIVLQWVGVGIFSIGCMNFISRTDIGSPALVGVLSGNIILHVLGMGFDLYDYSGGFMKMSGLIMGIIMPSIMIFGLTYYLTKNLRTQN